MLGAACFVRQLPVLYQSVKRAGRRRRELGNSRARPLYVQLPDEFKRLHGWNSAYVLDDLDMFLLRSEDPRRPPDTTCRWCSQRPCRRRATCSRPRRPRGQCTRSRFRAAKFMRSRPWRCGGGSDAWLHRYIRVRKPGARHRTPQLACPRPPLPPRARFTVRRWTSAADGVASAAHRVAAPGVVSGVRCQADHEHHTGERGIS
jgi:hypothetical protein